MSLGKCHVSAPGGPNSVGCPPGNSPRQLTPGARGAVSFRSGQLPSQGSRDFPIPVARGDTNTAASCPAGGPINPDPLSSRQGSVPRRQRSTGIVRCPIRPSDRSTHRSTSLESRRDPGLTDPWNLHRQPGGSLINRRWSDTGLRGQNVIFSKRIRYLRTG